MVESVESERGEDDAVITPTQRHAGKWKGKGTVVPLWRSMLSYSSPLYRNSLFSFSFWEKQVRERELVLLRKQMERERRVLQPQIEK